MAGGLVEDLDLARGEVVAGRFRVVAPISDEVALFVVDDLASGARVSLAILEDEDGDLARLGEEGRDLDGVIVPIATGRDESRGLAWGAFPSLGEPLGAYRARRGPCAIDEVSDIVRATCEVVALLHARALDHGALAPWAVFRRGIGHDPELAHVSVLAPSIAARVVRRHGVEAPTADLAAIAALARLLAGDLDAPPSFERWCRRADAGSFSNAETAALAVDWGGDLIGAISSRRVLEERIEFGVAYAVNPRPRPWIRPWLLVLTALVVAVLVVAFIRR